MDSQRARQIMESTGVIEVLYQGSPVWIENITGKDQAEVTYLGNSKKAEVPVIELTEGPQIKG